MASAGGAAFLVGLVLGISVAAPDVQTAGQSPPAAPSNSAPAPVPATLIPSGVVGVADAAPSLKTARDALLQLQIALLWAMAAAVVAFLAKLAVLTRTATEPVRYYCDILNRHGPP